MNPFRRRGCRHCFEARYDEFPLDSIPTLGSGHAIRCEGVDFRGLFTRRIYVKDVCVRCGAEVARTPELKPEESKDGSTV